MCAVKEFSDHSFREVGVAMSFMLVHRVSGAYSHFWQARAAVGDILIQSRALVRSICTCTSKTKLGLDVRETTARRVIMLFTLQRLKLQEASAAEKEQVLRPFIQFECCGSPLRAYADRLFQLNSNAVLSSITLDVQNLLSEGVVPPPLIGSILGTVTSLDEAITATDKQLGTRFPLPYQQLLSLGMLIFLLLIPLPLVADWGWHIPIPTTFASAFLLGLESLSRRLFKSFSLNAVSSGEPFFCMNTMGFNLQGQCWNIVDDSRTALPPN